MSERLREVLVGERQPDEDEAILAGLVAALDLVGTLVEKEQREEAGRGAEELGKGNELGKAAGQAIKAAHDAVMAAIVASTVAASTARPPRA